MTRSVFYHIKLATSKIHPRSYILTLQSGQGMDLIMLDPPTDLRNIWPAPFDLIGRVFVFVVFLGLFVLLDLPFSAELH